MIEELFDNSDRKLVELADGMRAIKQRLAGLEQVARQPRLAMEADVPSDTKTHSKRMEDAVAVQAKHGDSCSANQVDPDPMCLTSFGDDSTGPPALSCSRDDALVGNGAAAPKSCLSPLEIRTPTAAGGLLPASTTSTATTTIFDQPPLWFCLAEEINLKTSIQYASYASSYYSSFWWINDQLAAPSWWRVI